MNDVDTICPPNGPPEPDGRHTPRCNCSLAYALAGITERATLRHVGQAPVYWPLFPHTQPPWPQPPAANRFGSFFSTGAPGHCTGVLGTEGCTWKMRSVVRVLAFHDLERAGFYNFSRPYRTLAHAEASAKAFVDAWEALDRFILASPMKK